MYNVLVSSFVILALCLANVSAQCENATTLFVNDPESCAGYFLCSNGEALKGSCPDGYYFNEKDQTCDYPENVNCLPVPPTLSPITTTTQMTTISTVAPSICNGTSIYFVAAQTSCNDYVLCQINGDAAPGKCPVNFPYFSEENQACTQDINECTYTVTTATPITVSTVSSSTDAITTPTTTVEVTSSTSPVEITTPTSTVSIPSASSTEGITQSTTSAPVGNICTIYKNYFVASTTSCAEYYYCNAEGIPSSVVKCPDGFYFTQLLQACDYDELVTCNIP